MKIFINEIPTQVNVYNIFKIKFRLINCRYYYWLLLNFQKFNIYFIYFSSTNVEPVLYFINSESNNIMWLGLTNKSFGSLQQAQSIEVVMQLYPIKSGLSSIPLMKVTDTISKDNYDFVNMGYVNIV